MIDSWADMITVQSPSKITVAGNNKQDHAQTHTTPPPLPFCNMGCVVLDGCDTHYQTTPHAGSLQVGFDPSACGTAGDVPGLHERRAMPVHTVMHPD